MMSKLIRDNYESIIDTDRMYIAEDISEKFIFLKDKIYEELEELSETAFNDIEEYADVIEVIYAMAEFQGIYRDEIETARINKLKKRGGFKKWLILKE